MAKRRDSLETSRSPLIARGDYGATSSTRHRRGTVGWRETFFRTRAADDLTSEHIGVNSGSDKGSIPAQQPALARTLGALDLTSLGVGSTLGAGIYVITGVVAKTQAGPAIVVSFAIAGMASILAGLCYAEFGSRVPKAGSAYVYSYVTVGELIAWITGWNLILEYIIGAASVARAWSGYFDSLCDNRISHFMEREMGGWRIPGLGSYPDFFALGITLLLSAVVAVGVKASSRFNNVLTVVNMLVVGFVIIAGLWFVAFGNWSNFTPFGFPGIFAGAATSFYAYIGFDVIATSAEETIRPERNIPIGIICSLVVCALSYMGVSAVVTLMVDYSEINTQAPLADAFGVHGVHWAKTVIAVGALCGLSTSLMAAIFPLPRVVYAIASDGLLFQWLGAVSKRFKTPVNATAVCGTLAAVMAFAFDIQALADMMSIGTLMSYTLVAACVLILRYRRPDNFSEAEAEAGRSNSSTSTSGEGAGSAKDQLLGGGDGNTTAAVAAAGSATATATASPPTAKLCGVSVHPEHAVVALVCIFATAAACFGFVTHAFKQQVDDSGIGAIIVLALCVLVAFVSGVMIWSLPRYSTASLTFKCPWVPLIPLVSMFVNIYLLLSLNKWTWVRFGVWLAIGMVIYFAYGVAHSKARAVSMLNRA